MKNKIIKNKCVQNYVNRKVFVAVFNLILYNTLFQINDTVHSSGIHVIIGRKCN